MENYITMFEQISGLSPFVNCWLNECPPGLDRSLLRTLFDKYMEPAIDWMRRNVKEIVGSYDIFVSILN